jgi:DNA repair exonuclease SbcCD ATPase subunit
MDLEKYKKFYYSNQSKLDSLKLKKSEMDEILSKFKNRKEDLNKAKDVMNAVGILAQQEVKTVIEDLVTDAMQSVFGPEYEFKIEDEIKHGKPESYLYIIKNGKRRSLKDESGGTIAVLVAFVLRVVLWAISSNKTRNTLILDEPLKDASADKMEFFGEMIKKLSSMLGVQFIIITHEDEITKSADTVFVVKQVNEISHVEKYENA